MSFHHPFLQRQPTLFPLAVQRAGQAWGGHTPINRRCAVRFCLPRACLLPKPPRPGASQPPANAPVQEQASGSRQAGQSTNDLPQHQPIAQRKQGSHVEPVQGRLGSPGAAAGARPQQEGRRSRSAAGSTQVGLATEHGSVSQYAPAKKPSGRPRQDHRSTGRSKAANVGASSAKWLNSELRHASSIAQMDELVRDHSGMFDHIHLSAAWVGLEHLYEVNPEQQRAANQECGLSQRLMELTLRHVAALRGRQVANILHAFTVVQPAQLPAVASAFDDALSQLHPSSFEPRHVSQVLWAWASLRDNQLISAAPSAGAMQPLHEAILHHCHGMDGQGLANTVWALAKLGCKPSKSIVDALSDAIKQQAAIDISSFTPQGLSCLMYAFGLQPALRPAIVVMQLLGTAIQHAAAFMDPQHIANATWGFAKLDYTPSMAVLQAMAAAVAKLLSTDMSSFKPQELSNLMYAYAVHSALHPGAKVMGLLEQVAPRLKPQDVANISWALAELQHNHPSKLTDQLLGQAQAAAPQMGPNEITQVLYAAATWPSPAGHPAVLALALAAVVKLPDDTATGRQEMLRCVKLLLKGPNRKVACPALRQLELDLEEQLLASA